MKLSELKQIIRECIEETFLLEKTPNQIKHPRKASNKIPYKRRGTDYGQDKLSYKEANERGYLVDRQGKQPKFIMRDRKTVLGYNTSKTGQSPVSNDRVTMTGKTRKVKRMANGRAVGSKLP